MNPTSSQLTACSLIASALSVPSQALAQPTAEAVSPSFNSDLTLLLLYVMLALCFSFMCSIAEAVLLSITPSYIEGQKDKRPKHAAHLKRIKQDNVDRSLAAILALNTIAHTVGAIGAGAKAVAVFGNTWFGVFSAVMTLLILFVSEIIPKTIGAIYWSKLVTPTVVFVDILVLALYPFVWFSEKLTKFISHGKEVHLFSRDEFAAMARFGQQSGHINANESRIIKNLLRFGSLKITDIMTPRTVISALPENQTFIDAFNDLSQTPFSRIPLYKTDIDDISGFILRDDALLKRAQGQSTGLLKEVKRSVLTVPGSVSLSVLLERLIKERHHIAIVVDEYGGTQGLVTLEDVIETLIGVEILDETDKVEDMQSLARELWKQRVKVMNASDDTQQTNGSQPPLDRHRDQRQGTSQNEQKASPTSGRPLIFRGRNRVTQRSAAPAPGYRHRYPLRLRRSHFPPWGQTPEPPPATHSRHRAKTAGRCHPLR